MSIARACARIPLLPFPLLSTSATQAWEYKIVYFSRGGPGASSVRFKIPENQSRLILGRVELNFSAAGPYDRSSLSIKKSNVKFLPLVQWTVSRLHLRIAVK